MYDVWSVDTIANAVYVAHVDMSHQCCKQGTAAIFQHAPSLRQLGRSLRPASGWEGDNAAVAPRKTFTWSTLGRKATLPALPARRGGGGGRQCRRRCVASEAATRKHWPGVRRLWRPAPLAARQVPSVALAHLSGGHNLRADGQHVALLERRGVGHEGDHDLVRMNYCDRRSQLTLSLGWHSDRPTDRPHVDKFRGPNSVVQSQ